MSDEISQLSIHELLSDGAHYVIPMYQRNYAWNEGEITQLIQDVIDYMPDSQSVARNYYIGTLMVFPRQSSGRVEYETIDGQQRLTTLSLLACYLNNAHHVAMPWYTAPRLHFESRVQSQKTLAAIFTGAFERERYGFLAAADLNHGMVDGYRLIQKILPRKLEDNAISLQAFAAYLFKHVTVMRVAVPPHTDLNHYFEIMNSRGEQLEKHEILKAYLMRELREDADAAHSQHCLHTVWEACANMERYVQMGFATGARDAIFGQGDWGTLCVNGFPQLSEALRSTTDGAARSEPGGALTIDQIIALNQPTATSSSGKKDEPAPERFHAVINFPNFLLQVLRTMTQENVPLDDKALIATFEKYVLKAEHPLARIKEFVYALLRCKLLFDHFVIKRDFAENKEGWSLKRLKWQAPSDKRSSGVAQYVNAFGPADDDDEAADNRSILMLQAAFHVSAPTLVYKHWLSAALNHLYYAPGVHQSDYLRYLTSVARAFVFDRFLAGPTKADYFEMIYTRRGQCQTRYEDIKDSAIAYGLSYRGIENNLVFNYLDYLLWSTSQDADIRKFEFTFRSSVEHYYPQNPMEGQPALAAEVLDSFGNLCLISHSKNSRLSNFTPELKTGHSNGNHIDSIKQHYMMKTVWAGKKWDEAAIEAHGKEMIEVLVDSLKAT